MSGTMWCVIWNGIERGEVEMSAGRDGGERRGGRGVIRVFCCF